MGESVKGAAASFLGCAVFGALVATAIFYWTADTCTLESFTYDCVGGLNLEQFVAANGTGWGVVGAIAGWLISES